MTYNTFNVDTWNNSRQCFK